MFERVLPLHIRRLAAAGRGAPPTGCRQPEAAVLDGVVDGPSGSEAVVELRVVQASTGSEAVVVWDAALVLAYYLEHRQEALRLDQGPQTVLELGSGTGAVGLVAAALGARTVLTDLPEVLPLLERNIDLNRRVLDGPAQARALPWGHDHLDRVSDLLDPGVDYILVSDCVYYEAALEPLIDTLVALSRAQTRVLVSYEERTSPTQVAVQRRFRELVERHFRIHPVPPAECHPDYACPEIKLWTLEKRPSLSV
ncbi:hypothetical protein TCAL_03390 [Tigriopus californicus]|uniref:Protein-lysine methyltransferase METTL21D n=1 Tax=Tigriopus californicus TaxID=6832 RepID=A0A553P4S3_TIGCA|nr:protein N-lysine methyltransferase METTL21D-like [Tigriopus californicus]TRY72694.1 hypothetical protein TCAL_03390 [Tigriopus californicus]